MGPNSVMPGSGYWCLALIPAGCILQAMRGELDRQEPMIQRVTDHVDQAQDGLANVQRSAEKTLGKKGTHLLTSLYPEISFPASGKAVHYSDV